MPRRVRVLIEGKVQGVFFRDATTRLARDRNVAGWIRNLPDGRVEAVFEGEDPDVQSMITWAWNGPDDATVIDVQVNEEEPEGEQDFVVRRAT